jgi:hypothetical protein
MSRFPDSDYVFSTGVHDNTNPASMPAGIADGFADNKNRKTLLCR